MPFLLDAPRSLTVPLETLHLRSETLGRIGRPHGWSVCLSADAAGTVVLELAGDVCLVTTNELRQVLDDVVFSGASTVVLDLGKVDCLTAAGVNLIVHLERFLSERGGQVRVAAASPASRRVIEVCGLDHLLELRR